MRKLLYDSFSKRPQIRFIFSGNLAGYQTALIRMKGRVNWCLNLHKTLSYLLHHVFH